jgi:hypothetical protein
VGSARFYFGLEQEFASFAQQAAEAAVSAWNLSELFTATLLLGRSPLLFLIFLRGLTLSLGLLFGVFLVLLGGPFSLTAILSDAAVLALSNSRHRPCNSRDEQQYRSCDSFHNISEGKFCSDINTEGW